MAMAVSVEGVLSASTLAGQSPACQSPCSRRPRAEGPSPGGYRAFVIAFLLIRPPQPQEPIELLVASTSTASRASPRARATRSSPTRVPTPSPSCAWRAGATRTGVAVAVFPELGLSGYSIEDLLLQDAVLDEVEAALAEIVAASASTAAGAGVRRAAAAPAPDLQLRGGRAPRGGSSGSCPSPTRRTTGSSTSAGRSPRARTSAAGRSGSGRRTCRSAWTCSSRPRTCRAWCCTRRSARTCGCRSRRAREAALAGRHGAGEPVRQPDHRGPGRGPQAAVPLGLGTLPGRLRLRRRGPGRVEHRPVLGRPDHDLRERHAAGRDRALPARGRRGARRRRPGPAAAGAAADGHVRRQPPRQRPAHLGVPERRPSSSNRRPPTWGCAAPSSASRSCPPTPTGWRWTATIWPNPPGWAGRIGWVGQVGLAVRQVAGIGRTPRCPVRLGRRRPRTASTAA